MKKIILTVCFCASFLNLAAQNEAKQSSSLAFHLFYYDFNTAQLIKTTSLNNVLTHGKWSNFRDMQLGFGFNYIKGLNQAFDLIGTLAGSGTNYLFKDGTTNGSSKFLLDINIGANFKIINDEHAVAPYFFAGAGFSYYQKKYGAYLPLGLGLRFNIFNEAFILANAQYRIAATNQVNDHFYYSLGFGLPISRKKSKKSINKREITIVPNQISEVQLAKKELLIKVIDEQTGIPLTAASVTLSKGEQVINAITNVNGEVVFNSIVAGNYEIKGILNGISTNIQMLQSDNFNNAAQEIKVTLLHHDPRFTLSGIVEEKSTGKPIAGATLTVVNQTKGSKENMQNNADGTFNLQLDGGNDYVFSAKKENHLSDIDSVSTKGLNRSTTLYVKLSLGMEEAKANNAIVLQNIYYHTGSVTIDQQASSDLNKLVLFLTDHPNVRMEIASHSDSRGSAASNLLLSQRRAQEVVNYLQKNGIDRNRLIPRGYGETKLINGCKDGVACTEAQHQKNRRTEFKILNN